MFRKIFFLVFGCFLGVAVNAQEITNVTFLQVGKTIEVNYDLSGSESGTIQLFYSTNDGKSYNGPLKAVSGEVGKNQKSGTAKKIVWDVLAEGIEHTGNIKFKVKCKSDKIHDVVEENPKFKGGMAKLYQYLAKNIQYPEMAHVNGVEGKVFVQFVVMKDGRINYVKVVKGAHSSLNNEAIRVVKSMPKWIPGRQRGMAVNARFTLPIKFRITEN